MSTEISKVVGRNCRDLRTAAGLTRSDLVRAANNAGMRWTASKVADIETGTAHKPTLELVSQIAYVLTVAGSAPVSLADLIRTDGRVAMSDGLEVDGARWSAALLGGGSWPAIHPEPDPELDELAREALGKEGTGQLGQALKLAVLTSDCRRRAGLDEQRMAKRLGVDDAMLARASAQLWGKTFSEERDHRAGGGNAQKRGRIARLLADELKKEIGL